MKKDLLNIFINEVRKNKALRVLLIETINKKSFYKEVYYHLVMILEEINDYLDFDNLLFDIEKILKDNDCEADNITIIEALTQIYNSIEE